MMNARLLWQQAEQHAAREDWTRARQAFLLLLQHEPRNASALLQLSYIESLAKNYRKARDYALEANAVEPRDPDVLRELMARLRTFNEAGALHRCIERVSSTAQISIPLLIGFAAQMSYLNEQERALHLLDQAKRVNPVHPPTLLARAQVLTYLGRFGEAETELRQCLSRAPLMAQARWFLSHLHKQSVESNHVADLRAMLALPGRKPEDIAFLAFALHKELDDLGEISASWAVLEQACRAKRSTLTYSPAESRALVSSLIELAATHVEQVPTSSKNSRVPIFVVGMHRSGTTLLEQLLDGHPDVRGVGELYDFTSQMRYATDHHCRGVIDATIVARAGGVDFAAVGAGYLEGVEWRLGAERYFTDKLPSNFLNLGFICKALPQAKILHMVRDPVETCFSNLRELFSDANPYSYDQVELAEYYKQYRRLMAHWHRVWPGRILDVDYAELTRDPESVLRKVTAFCGLAFEPEMLQLHRRTRGVATASAVQVRDKVILREQPKWAPYAEYLQPMIRALDESQQ